MKLLSICFNTQADISTSLTYGLSSSNTMPFGFNTQADISTSLTLILKEVDSIGFLLDVALT